MTLNNAILTRYGGYKISLRLDLIGPVPHLAVFFFFPASVFPKKLKQLGFGRGSGVNFAEFGPSEQYRESSNLARVQLLRPRSSLGSCCIKTTKWWYIIFGFSKCGLPVSNLFLRSVFNFNLKLVDVTSSWRWSTKLKLKMATKNIFETGKWICAKIIWNMALWSSSYGTVQLRYGGFSMESLLALVL